MYQKGGMRIVSNNRPNRGNRVGLAEKSWCPRPDPTQHFQGFGSKQIIQYKRQEG